MRFNAFEIRSIFSIVFLLLLCTVSFSVKAQDDFDQFLEAGVEDANVLLQAYMEPLVDGVQFGISNGWYNTAKPHKPFGIDITVTASAAFVPDEDLFYNFADLNLTNVRLLNPSDGELPTFFGTDDESRTPEFELVDQPGITFEGPLGINLEDEIGFTAIPVPMAQVGIGIFKNTDLKVRFIPEINFGTEDEASFKMIGFGIMHDIKQHIPGLKLLPFDLSVFAGYTDVTTEIDLSGDLTNQGFTQVGVYDINSFTFQGIISKKFSVLTLYGAVGFNTVRTNLKLLGEYDIDDDGAVDLVDPIDLDFSAGGPRLTGGLRLKLAILTIHGDYTLQEYNTLTVGIGLSVR
ncbi:MAG: DUF6588 family protein [Bacteroidota bacterium]